MLSLNNSYFKIWLDDLCSTNRFTLLIEKYESEVFEILSYVH